MLNNNYLFASQFLDYLKAEKIQDEERFEGFRSTVKSFLKTNLPADIEQLQNTFIIGLIAQLQFAAEPFNIFSPATKSKYAYLYDSFPLQHKISCVYLIPPQDDPDANTKGNFPAFDLIHLLKKEKLEWGILTNGKVWRLYSTLTPLPYENYLEIDFSEANEEDYRVFWQLFTLHLFIPDEYDVTRLEKYIEESEKEAEQIEKHIRSSIDEILENISFGFLTYAGKDKQPLSEEEKKEYFENSVYLLFRLLFVFYAESRRLLPVNHPDYQQKSLEYLLAKAKEWRDNGMPEPDGTDLWTAFRDLCIAIDQGNNALGIPEYDGGLFDSSEHAFLSDTANQLTNHYFARVLYRLGYFQRRKNQETKIEYRDLSVRSLGSLYEGILEYKLFIATEDMVIRQSDKKAKILPKSHAGMLKKSDRLVEKGFVYFSQDAQERHDTGSYYTPEDVVSYMVQNSVRLGLEERWMDFLPQVQRYEKELKQAVNEDTRMGILKKFDRELLQFVESEILTFKVMDPAMGSGHFLVNALNTITHFILEALQGKVFISEGPIQHDKTPLPVNWELFDHANPDVNLNPLDWRRRVVEKCIFGIDINPLATELAKLSLWIASAAEGKPLTFLNHHLKTGDSVMGVRLQDLLTYPGKEENSKEQNLFEKIHEDDITRIKKQFELLLSAGSDEPQNVFSKKENWEGIERDPFLRHLKDMATLWLMLSFNRHNKWMEQTGLQAPDEKTYFELLEAAQPGEEESRWQQRLGADLYDAIRKFVKDKRVFHWELEFPEIINSGFESIVANPPYVDISNSQYFALSYLPIKSNNLYSYILAKSIEHRDNEMFNLGFIIPNSIIVSKRMKYLRDQLFSQKNVFYRFVNIDSTSYPSQLFKNVKARISITFAHSREKKSTLIVSSNYKRFYSYERKLLFNNINEIPIPQKFCIDEMVPKIGSSLEISILEKLFDKKGSLGDKLTNKETNSYIYYKSIGANYLMAFEEPPFFQVNGKKLISSTLKKIYLEDTAPKFLFISIFYSSLFFWFWIAYSDFFHVTQSDIKRFPINLNDFKQDEFEDVTKELLIDINDNANLVTYKKASGVTEYLEFKPRYSKHLFDQIDSFLGAYYGLTDEEVDYIINYDIKYRTDEENLLVSCYNLVFHQSSFYISPMHKSLNLGELY